MLTAKLCSSLEGAEVICIDIYELILNIAIKTSLCAFKKTVTRAYWTLLFTKESFKL